MIRCIILALVLLFGASPARSQYLFNTLTTADGLSSKEILCSYKDTLGFMWFGAENGLNRYDGSHVKIITPYTKDMPGLPSESIVNIVEYGYGKLWIGTRKGLCFLDRRLSRFILVPLIRGRDTIMTASIKKLLIDKNHRLWAATSEGLFGERNGQMLAASTFYHNAASLDSFSCTAHDAGRDTRALYLLGNTEVKYFDYGTGEVFSKAYNPQHSAILDSGRCNTLVAGPDGRIWYSRERDGLGWYDPATHKGYSFPEWKDRLIYKMSFDSKGWLWICATDYHIYVLSPDGKFTEILSQPENPYRLAFARFHHFYEDRDGNLWLGTPAGVSKLPARPVLQNIVAIPRDSSDKDFIGSLSNTIRPADSGRLWICRMSDLLLMDTRNYTFRRYKAPTSWEPLTNNYYDVQLNGKEWWCATGTGIVAIDPATGTFSRLAYQPAGVAKEARAVVWIRKGGDGTMWASVWNDGIYRLDAGTKKWILTTGPLQTDADRVTSYFGFVDRRGQIYASYGNKGLRVYDSRAQKWVTAVTDTNDKRLSKRVACYAMVEDTQGRKWISTSQKGIYMLDQRGVIADSISLRNGLRSNAVGSLWMQDNGRLWISTSEGLQHTLTDRKMLSGFALDEGISVINFSFPLLQVGQKLIVGMQGELAVIDLPTLEAQQIASPKPLLTGFQVSGADIPLPFGEGTLKLSYKQNFFNITFSSPMHKEMYTMAYQYKLEGFDKDWVDAGRNQIASYTAVPAGKYRFLVRTTNANGEWSDNITALSIQITPPFWLRWWAILLALVIIGVLAYILYLNNQRRKRNRQMEKAVNYFANSIHGHNSVKEICWDIARNCIAQMGLEDCVVYLRDEQRPVMIQMAAYGPKSTEGFGISNPIEIEIGRGIVGTVAITGQPCLVKNTSKDPRYIVDDEARSSELAVPIIHDGEVIGVIDSEHSRKGYYTEAHLKAFTTIASITSNKIAEAKAEAEVKAKAVQLLEIQKLLAESQLMALRAQMNPHFVFNCLNSIQECIVTAKYGEASLYLNKFSKLFRMLLNNSGKGLITLAEEIEVLELYLSLEHMRFERNFEYAISIDEELDIAEILIPSMLLQPFVENALWHGLMHKEGDRRLSINFASVTDDLFRCTIDDNGIGREKVKQLKAAKGSNNTHHSRGMKITADRVGLMQRQGQTASITIQDKYDPQGQAAGTTIIIELSSYLTSATL